MPFTKYSTERNPQRATKKLDIGKIASFSFKIKFFVVAVGTEISLFYHLHRKSKLKFSQNNHKKTIGLAKSSNNFKLLVLT